MKEQSKQSKGLVALKIMQFSKPRRPLDVATSQAKRFSPFFPQLAKRIQSQGSSYNGLADLLIRFAVSVVEPNQEVLALQKKELA